MKWVLAAVCAVLLIAASPAQAVVLTAPRGESAFKVPRGVTQIKVVAVGERGGGPSGGIGREVTRTIDVTPGDVLTLRVGTGGGAGAFPGGGLSGVYGAGPLVVAAGGGGSGSTGPGAPAGSGNVLTVSDGGPGASGGGGGGAGRFGGGGGVGGAGGSGGSSFPVDGVTATQITPLLTLEYPDADAPAISLLAPDPLNPTFVEGVAGTEGGDAGGVSVRLYAGDRPAGEPFATSNAGFPPDGSFSMALGPLADGIYTVQAAQLDIAGHEGVSNPVTFTMDREGPHVQLTWPGPVTGDAHTSIEGSLGSEPGDLEEVSVTVTGPNGYSQAAAVQLRGSAFTATLPAPLVDGTYRVIARQGDIHQHVGTATATFVVDTVAPALTLASPDGDVAAVTLAGTASERGDVFIVISAGGTAERRITVPVVNGAFSAALTLPDGAYTATARFADEAGNAAVVTRAFRVISPVPPLAAPAVAPVPQRVVVVVPHPVSALKITRATRRGRTLTVKGTAPGSTGTVTVTAGSVKKRVKLTRGGWSATLRLKRAKKVTVTVVFAGTTVKKSVR